jgi:hypothetical protein
MGKALKPTLHLTFVAKRDFEFDGVVLETAAQMQREGTTYLRDSDGPVGETVVHIGPRGVEGGFVAQRKKQ